MTSSTAPPLKKPLLLGVPLRWRDKTGYQCPYCSLYHCVPQVAWATCPRCPGIPLDEVVSVVLEDILDESSVDDVVAALQPLLASLEKAAIR